MMGRSIKVSDEVYESLLKLQRTRETFSDVIGRLQDIHEGVQQLIKVMNDTPAYQRWKARQEARKRP